MSDGFTVEAYCDGSCKGNPGPGGWGIYLRLTRRVSPVRMYVRQAHGGKTHTTNSEMELFAMYQLLDAVPYQSVVQVYSDSQYVLKALVKNGDGEYKPSNMGHIKNWIRDGWKIKNGNEPAHVNVWKLIKARCDELVENGCSISFYWVKGHSGVEGNEIVDKLAKQGCNDNTF